jgi:riboflavin synthase
MFTGIVEAVGTLAERAPTGTGYRIRIETDLAPQLTRGESVAVNGVCLTATEIERSSFRADIGTETARITTLGGLPAKSGVNLERSLRFDGRISGHLVQGHVDGVGSVTAVRPDGETQWLTISYPPELAPYVVFKGSIAVDGVSLTVANLHETHFDVQIVPHTWTATTLRVLARGSRVNLECDMIGKYVVRALQLRDRNGVGSI